jgi:hypothetical protein
VHRFNQLEGNWLASQLHLIYVGKSSLGRSLNQERAMRVLGTTVSGIVLALTLLSSTQRLAAQAISGTQTQPLQPAVQTDDPDPTAQVFTGVIVRSGDRVVLTDTLSKTSFQLDDQPKARNFLNKNVRVTGTLDPATGTIRVSAIEGL